MLAQAEWHDETIVDGLMLDTEGELVERHRSNVFLVRERRAGHAGSALLRRRSASCAREVLRAAKELGIAVSEEPLWPHDVEAASEVFLTNAVRGIRPVHRARCVALDSAPVADRLRQALDF